MMKVVLWKDILEDLQKIIGKHDVYENIVGNFGLSNSVKSIERNGKRVVYYNGGKKIIDFENDCWGCFEREDGSMRWYPTRLDSEGRNILREYYYSIMKMKN